MKKTILNLTGLSALICVLFLGACKKDTLTGDQAISDETAAQARLSKTLDSLKNVAGVIQYSVNVVKANQSTYVTGRTAASGQVEATVTVSQYGQTVTATTTNGIVSFPNCRIGSTNVVVQMNGFTTIDYKTSLTPPDSGIITSGSIRQVSTMVPIFAVSGAGNTAQIQGTVTLESDLTNSTPELAPATTVVSANIDANDPAFQATYLTRDGKAGSIISIAYEDAFSTTTLSATGTYTLTVPASVDKLPIKLVVTDVILNQKLYINNFQNVPFVNPSVQNIPTTFSQTVGILGYTAVPSVYPVTVTIAPPPAQGSGATVTAVLKATSVESGAGFTVLNGGSGYGINQTGIPVTVNGGSFDNTVTGFAAAALTANSNASGEIVSISGTNGMGYRGQATLTIGGSGSGAIVQPNYASTIANLGSTTNANDGSSITAGGSGYLSAPTARIQGTGPATYVNVTTSTTIYQNAVATINFAGVANTFTQAPTVTFDAQPSSTATARVNTLNGIVGGKISSIVILNAGQGYNPNGPAPTVTLGSLAPGGFGAIVNAVMNGAGDKVASINILDGGSGYSTGNYPSFMPFSISPAALYVSPNGTYVRDVYYGTGTRDINMNAL